MRTLVLLSVVILALTLACADPEPAAPAAIPFTKIDLPAGAQPVVLSPDGDALLIGTRRPDQEVVPGLMRRAPDGTLTEIPARHGTPYGRQARWWSLSSDGSRIVGLGGERGGAHANVRWSIWSGSTAGISEQPQGFSTFQGPDASDLLDVVLTPSGPHIVGMWAHAGAGVDVAVWNNSGAVWTRQPPAGTPLESTPDALAFPNSATAAQDGILISGSVLTASGQQPVVWRSTTGTTGWTRTPLPDPGKSGAALAARCQPTTCAVAGRVDDTLAIWLHTNNSWTRLPNTPPIHVGDRDRLTAPLEVDGHLTHLIPDQGRVKLTRGDGTRWTTRDTSGPTGTVTATTTVGDALYVIAGADENSQTLWRADLSSIR